MSGIEKDGDHMPAQKYNTLAEYLADLDPVKAGTIQAIFDLILGEFPQLQAKMAWNVPQIHRAGKYVAGIAAYKNHLTYAPWSQNVTEAFRPRLAGYEVFKGCFQIPVDWQIDEQLVLDLVRARLAELG